MFFSSDLLIFKRGKFNLIWLAATRGEKYLTKKDLNMVDLHHACSEIMDYVLRHQKIKLSLYLSSQLTFGLCVIYHKKIDKLLNDLQDLYKKSLVTFTVNNVNQSDRNRGAKKGRDKHNLTMVSILDDFGEINDSFGVLKNLENNHEETDMDLTNQIAYLNQARFEDITMMEYDYGQNNIRNQLDNDLEPMNLELLQELLGSTDFNKNDLETYLNQPFDVQIEKEDEKIDEMHIGNQTEQSVQEKIEFEVDLDKTLPLCEEKENNADKMETDANLEQAEYDRNHNLNERPTDAETLIRNDVKVSCAIEEVEKVNLVGSDSYIELQYPRKHTLPKQVTTAPKILKRKANRKTLIIDQTTTLSHQVIRDNMNKKAFGLVDKNMLFPNAYVTKSLKAQIACSATNLFEFPGCYNTLFSQKLLRLWMDRKDACKSAKSPFIDYETFPNFELNNQETTNLNFSELSIEKFREASSYNMNIPVDSFTLGSDGIQKSIQQSFEVDRTLEENNPYVPEIIDEIVPNSLEKSMMPIIEEDFNSKFCVNNEIPHETKILEKGDIWRVLQALLKTELNTSKNWNDVRVAFTDLCPKHSTKKTAAMVFLTLLRLGKYGKIQIFQENSLTEIFIGLPAREI